MTPQQIADHELRVWQERRHLKPIYRLIDCPPLVPEDGGYDAKLEAVARAVNDV